MLQKPTTFTSKRCAKEVSVEAVRPPFGQNAFIKSENSDMNTSIRNREEHRNFQTSSGTFYKHALKGDTLGQKAMNDIRLRNH